MTDSLVKVENLKKYFPVKLGVFEGWHFENGKLKRKRLYVKAIDGVSFEIEKGDTFALVGESGCGKTTTGRTIVGLYKQTDGKIYFRNKPIDEVLKKSPKDFKKNVQMIFQDPYSSLNPRMKVYNLISEPLRVHKLVSSRAEEREKVEEIMVNVGLEPEYKSRYPHQFSGGQRQRIAIARALATEPEFIVADEPISALDVSIRAQILNLMEDLQEKYGLTYLFIAHDLSVVRHISNKTAVMYLGRIVEMGNTDEIFTHPLHPYTKTLFDSIPSVEKVKQPLKVTIEGEVPSPINPPPGCPFHPRCPHAMERCKKERPEPKEVSPGHFVSCFLY